MRVIVGHRQVRAAVSVCGTIQPGTLARALTQDYLDAGLAARLLLAMPPKQLKKWSEVEIHPETEDAYRKLTRAGAPVLALWVGSRVVGHRALTMGAVFLVVVLLAVFVGTLAFALTWLNGRYDTLIDRPEGRRIAPWLRSIRAEDQEFLRAKQGSTPVEWIITGSTVVAILCLEVWFFFFAGSPLPS